MQDELADGGQAHGSMDDSAARSTIDPAPGLYEHYKGRRYRVIDHVRHSETEEMLVLYRALYGVQGLWVRPQSMFLESVQVDGRTRPRFLRIGD